MNEPGPRDGEEALIRRYFAPLARGFPGAHDLKDDCASLALPEGHVLVVTTDAIAEGVHFFADDAADDIAWKAIATAVSDLAAKAATPLCYLMALALPPKPDAQWLAKFTSGCAEAQAAFAMPLAGGDTDRRQGPLAITITALGALPREISLRRDEARAGDLIYVSGALGGSALGLALRSDPSRAHTLGLDEATAKALLTHYLRPTPRLALAQALRANAHAAMDISDGLAKDLTRMSRAAGVKIIIEEARVPLDPGLICAARSDAGLRDLALIGGDDYEILAAVPAYRSARFEADAEAAGLAVTAIGRCEEGHGLTILDQTRAERTLPTLGWDHFPE